MFAIFQAKNNFRQNVTIPRSGWKQVRDILDEFCSYDDGSSPTLKLSDTTTISNTNNANAANLNNANTTNGTIDNDNGVDGSETKNGDDYWVTTTSSHHRFKHYIYMYNYIYLFISEKLLGAFIGYSIIFLYKGCGLEYFKKYFIISSTVCEVPTYFSQILSGTKDSIPFYNLCALMFWIYNALCIHHFRY